MKEKKESVSKVSQVKVAEVKENVLEEELKMKLFRGCVKGVRENLYVVADTMENAIEKVREAFKDYSETITDTYNGVVREINMKLEEAVFEDITECGKECKKGIFGNTKFFKS